MAPGKITIISTPWPATAGLYDSNVPRPVIHYDPIAFDWDRWDREIVQPVRRFADDLTRRMREIFEQVFPPGRLEDLAPMLRLDRCTPCATATPPTHLPWPYALRCAPMHVLPAPSQTGLANAPMRPRACARQAVPARTRRRVRVWERQP